MNEVDIQHADLLSAEAAALIAELNAELAHVYPEQGATHFRLDPEEVGEGRGAFLIARRGGVPVGCGAIRRLDPDSAEIKRMYVVPTQRGRGISRRVLRRLEAEARRLGVRRLVLETGVRQKEALALYTSAGFVEVPPFGEYVGSPLSLCMAKELDRSPR